MHAQLTKLIINHLRMLRTDADGCHTINSVLLASGYLALVPQIRLVLSSPCRTGRGMTSRLGLFCPRVWHCRRVVIASIFNIVPLDRAYSVLTQNPVILSRRRPQRGFSAASEGWGH